MNLGLEVLELSILATPGTQSLSISNALRRALPCSSLAWLPQLRILKAPQTALPPLNFLPQTLEVVEVHQVNLDILEWIKYLHEDRRRFNRLANLRLVDLCLKDNQDVDLEGLKAIYKRYSYMEQLPRFGIELRIWWNGTEHVPEWRQEQYELAAQITERFLVGFKLRRMKGS